jgi:hypothetical protein
MSAAALPPDLRTVAPRPLWERVSERLRAKDVDAARAFAHAGRLIEAAGGRVVAAAEGPLFLAEDRRGLTFVAAPVPVRVPAQPRGAPDDVARLVRALDGALPGRAFAVLLKKPVPAGFDPAPFAAAVYSWSRDVDRGVAEPFVVWDDATAGVSIEIDLLRDVSEPTRLVVAAPRGPETLAALDRRLSQLDALARAAGPKLSWLPVLCATPAWRVGHGFRAQWLFGTATEIVATSGRTVRWSRPGGLFGEPEGRRLAGAWWVDLPDGAAPTCESHVNPWAERPIALSPAGRCMEPVDTAPDTWLFRVRATPERP